METLFIIILIIIFLNLAARYLLPLVLRRMMKKFSNRFQQGMNNEASYKQYKAKEGEIYIDSTTDKNKSHSNDVGEYVDYEEIK
ncbi:MAG: DUF4834 family protein [Bacteroidales bacterium]